MKILKLKPFVVLAILIMASPFSEIKAQGFFDFLKDEDIKEKVKDIVGDVASDYVDFSIIGKWSYEGATVDLGSDNALSDLGSSLLGSTMDEKVNEQLDKLGIKPGELFITFEKDSTFNVEVGQRKLSGKFSYDSKANKLTMTFWKKLPIKTDVKVETQSVSFLYNADAILKFVKSLDGKVNIAALDSILAILKNYDNLNIGLKFKAEDGRTLKDAIPGF